MFLPSAFRLNNHYVVLNVSRSASKQEVKRAYRALAKKYHPDINPSRQAQAMFTKIQAAYDVIGHDAKRRSYDRDLRDRSQGGAAGRKKASEWAQSTSHAKYRGKYDTAGRDGDESAANPEDYLGNRRNINEEFIEKLKKKERYYKAYGSGKYQYRAQSNYEHGSDRADESGRDDNPTDRFKSEDEKERAKDPYNEQTRKRSTEEIVEELKKNSSMFGQYYQWGWRSKNSDPATPPEGYSIYGRGAYHSGTAHLSQGQIADLHINQASQWKEFVKSVIWVLPFTFIPLSMVGFVCYAAFNVKGGKTPDAPVDHMVNDMFGLQTKRTEAQDTEIQWDQFGRAFVRRHDGHLRRVRYLDRTE